MYDSLNFRNVLVFCVDGTTLILTATVDVRLKPWTVYHTERPPLCTTLCYVHEVARCAGPSAKAGIVLMVVVMASVDDMSS